MLTVHHIFTFIRWHPGILKKWPILRRIKYNNNGKKKIITYHIILFFISTTVEVNEVADRMRKTCGLRQNTVDSSEYSSSKRLMPNITEQRRSSMTITPR